MPLININKVILPFHFFADKYPNNRAWGGKAMYKKWKMSSYKTIILFGRKKKRGGET